MARAIRFSGSATDFGGMASAASSAASRSVSACWLQPAQTRVSSTVGTAKAVIRGMSRREDNSFLGMIIGMSSLYYEKKSSFGR